MAAAAALSPKSDFATLVAANVQKGSVTDDFDIDVRRKLGSGGYANVYLGRRKSDKLPVAIKVIKQFRWNRPGADEIAVLREIEMMRHIGSLGSPHLLGAYCAYGQVFDTRRLCIVTPLCAGGDLFERISTMGRYTEQLAAQRFREVMVGLKQLHEAGILHRDIKPENLLLSDKSDEGAVAVLADFGLSELLTECGPGSVAASQLVGTLAYNAPEHLTSAPLWSPAGDVWAAGVVLFIMLGGAPPFYVDHRLPKRTHDAALRRVIRAGSFVFYEGVFDDISDRAKDLIRGMLNPDPDQRLSVDDCLAHPWLADTASNPDVHLEENLNKLRAFNARRKLRAAALACRWGARNTVRQEMLELLGDTPFSEEDVRALAAAFRQEMTKGEAGSGDGDAATAAGETTSSSSSSSAAAAAADSDAATLSRSASPLHELAADKTQFRAVMTALGHGSLPLDKLWDLFDVDGNGAVDVREVLCGFATLRSGGEKALELCFGVLDADGNGHLDREELEIALTALVSSGSGASGEETAALLAHAFDTMDVDKDGKVTLEEFKAGIAAEPELQATFISPIATLSPTSSFSLPSTSQAADTE